MTDKFYPQPLRQLLQTILNQYENDKIILGIPEELFFRPDADDKISMERFGQVLESPIGVAAGPHTQLSQNIVAAWLCGSRFIELKTIQTLDELEVSKPCIDMQDEGYNCEWSQELKIAQSFDQYLDAWILIHILKDKLQIGNPNEAGFIFNMSVGYDLAGILQDNVQWFFNKMNDASDDLKLKIESIADIYPNILKLKINPQLSSNITLSTMHGCPPDEIEKIGEYLINEKKLHTAIKLNPTLLGKAMLKDIFAKSGFDTQIPDDAFAHDLKWADALPIISNLQAQTDKQNLQFSIKLTNTLESKNHKEVFDSSQEMMYMSGRALHPLAVNLAAKLQGEFSGKLDISFSGGANAFNIADLVNSGLAPVTVCTDLLKPGGYGRQHQYIENLRKAKLNQSETPDYLEKYAQKVLNDEDYRKTDIKSPNIKTSRSLGFFDCIHAPCETTCPTHQGIPEYLYQTAQGNLAEAAKVVIETNPFPNTTGMVCDHLCQTKCTRINYDHPVLIREVKRVIAKNAPAEAMKAKSFKHKGKPATAAIVGAGPAGLSCAYFLAKAGFEVEIFESKNQPGGMVAGAIPSFRLTNEAFDGDVKRITGLGLKINYGQKIDQPFFGKLRGNHDFVFIAAGAQKSKPFKIKGSDVAGVIDPLDFLLNVKTSQKAKLGDSVVIIGGGNTAMDAARTAYRLVGQTGKVSIAYRRTIHDMPADLGEIKAVMAEGIEIIEWAAPVEIMSKNGRLETIRLRKMKPGAKDASGRARPVEIPGSDFIITATTIIPAIGQELAIDFMTSEKAMTKNGSYETQIPGVYIGGDALRGASTAINAIGDGRKAAQEIIDKLEINFQTRTIHSRPEKSYRQHLIDRARRIKAITIEETALNKRKNFALVQSPLSLEQGIEEAKRCLRCDEFCSICTTVCPNLALMTFLVEPTKFEPQKIKIEKGQVDIMEGAPFEITQKYQILHLADWCNQCGNCNTFCPTSGAPYKEKPHIFLNKFYFESEGNGFFHDGERLRAKVNGKEYSLQETGTGYVFISASSLIDLDKNLRITNYTLLKINNEKLNLTIAAQMRMILDGIKQIGLPM